LDNQKKIKLIIAISDSKKGGGQNVVLNLAKYLNKNETITLLCPKGDLYIRAKENGIAVKEMKFNFFNIYKINKFIRQFDKVVLNTHLLGTTFWGTLASIFNKRVSIVSNLHNPIIYDNISYHHKIFYPLVLKFISNRVKFFIADSKEISNSIKKYSNRSKVFYIPNSIFIDEPLIKKDNKNNNYNVCILGRLTFAKGHEYFISAAELICKERNDVNFFIIGEGELKVQLEEVVKEKSLESKIIFTGFVADLKSILVNIDIVVVPSLFEAIPLVLLEVMAMGIPVVATNVGGIPNVITNNINGLLVLPRNEREIYSAVIRLLNDENLRYQIGSNGRERIINNFNSEKLYREYCDILLNT
jgi:glycosyltransferase involved in cell wall biosynthesis